MLKWFYIQESRLTLTTNIRLTGVVHINNILIISERLLCEDGTS